MDPQTEFWMKLALWLADCQAATAHHVCDLKSSSQYEKKRHKDICVSTAAMLATKTFNRPFSLTNRLEQVVHRLASVGK